MGIFAQNDQFQQQKMTDFVNGKSSIGRQHWSWEITNSRKEKKSRLVSQKICFATLTLIGL